MKKVDKSEVATLRQKAEEQLKKQQSKESLSSSENDIRKITHELQVHQMELEIQNEELVLAKVESDAATSKYIELYDFAPSGYFTLSKEGKIIELNLKGASLLGKVRQRLINSMLSLFVSHDTKPIFNLFFNKVFEGKKNESCEVSLAITDNKQASYVFLTGHVSEDMKQCYITMVDISERRQSEDALRVSNDKFMNLANSIIAYVAYVNADTLRYEFVNDLYEESFGIPREKIIGSHIKDVLGEKNYKFALQYIKEVKAGKSVSYENTFDMASGKRWIQVNYSPVFDVKNIVVGIALVCHDITDLKQTEKNLLESEERFQLLFNKAPLGYQSLDFEGNFIDVNQQWLDTLGYAKNEVLGKWFGDFLSPAYQDGFRKRFPIFKSQGHIHSEFEMVHKNGSKLFIAFEGRVGYDKNGAFKQTHCILQDITERKKTEEKLLFINKAVESASDAIGISDAQGHHFYQNKALTDLFGYKTPEEIETLGGGAIVVKDTIVAKEMYGNIMNGIPWSGELEMVTKSGHVFPAYERADAIKDSEGKIIGLIGVITDFTEQKEREYALKESQSLLKSSIDSQKDTIIFSIDNNYQYLNFNKAHWDAMKFAYNADVKSEMNILDCITSDDDRLLAKKNYDRALNGESHSTEQVFGDVNPAYYESFFNPIRNDKNEVIGCTGLARNITQRRLAEEELKHSYIFNETLLKTIPYGMDVVDETGNVLFQSDNFKEIFGESAIGKKCWELYRDDKKQCSDCPLVKGITIGETEIYESHGVLGNRVFNISHTGMVFGGKKAMLEIFQDITEQKVNEQELIRAKEQAEESDRLKSAFLANMSHEIRTPMNGILGFAELLKEPHLTVEEQQDFIQTIQISGARMLNTINNIVDVSKLESGMMKVDINETNLNEKIEFTYKFFKPEVENKGLKFLFKNGLPSNEAIIYVDNEKVYGILTNLIKNAIKFTYEGSIEFGYVLKSDSEPAELQFFVKDTGVGFPEFQKELIFERFRQGNDSYDRKYEGSGLGLSISKSYVEMLGGRIWVESHEGSGTTFYFTIPYNPVSEETSTIENIVFTENKEDQLKKLKILIVEDDEISYTLLTRVIKKISTEVLHSITGVEAVEACRNNPDFDLVLMDIRMPQMNGLEATQQIRQFNKDVIIIAQTAYGFSSDCEKALEAGCNDYITKPINSTLLFELIKKHINK